MAARDRQNESIFSTVRGRIRRAGSSGGSSGTTASTMTGRRVAQILLIVIVATILLVTRLFYLQVVKADELSTTAREFRTRSYTQEAMRGDILDSSGAVLATSVERYNVRVNQAEIPQYVKRDENGDIEGVGAAAAAKELAPLLDMDRAELGGLLMGTDEKQSQWQLIKSDISPEKWREINALGIRGIYPERFMRREYPNGDVAGNILGYTGQTAEDETVVGRAGIEQSMDSHLAGTNGSLTVEVGPAGTVFPQGAREETPAVDGGSVQLTIDRDLQAIAQEAVQKSVDENSAQWGTAVVVEVGTGRVLALADSNSPDPSNLASVNPEDWNSRAVSAIVEPGSTGKLVTFSAAIDSGAVEPLDLYQVSSRITMPNGESIRDNDPHPTENMTVAGILAKSYNSGLVQIGDEIPDSKRYEYMLDFGLGQKTGIELPNEQAGTLTSYETWAPRTHYTTMFGQAWSLTTLQLAQIAATIGNDGVRVPLHITDGIYETDGSFTPTTVGESTQAISAETSQTMLQMMQAVTDPYSTGWLAAVDGYNVAGKTGTAQVPGPDGRLTGRVGTFAGVIPAEDPQIAVGVVIYNGAGPGYGGTTAAPVFADIAEFAMRQLKVPPSTEPLYRYPWTETELNAETNK